MRAHCILSYSEVYYCCCCILTYFREKTYKLPLRKSKGKNRPSLYISGEVETECLESKIVFTHIKKLYWKEFLIVRLLAFSLFWFWYFCFYSPKVKSREITVKDSTCGLQFVSGRTPFSNCIPNDSTHSKSTHWTFLLTVISYTSLLDHTVKF